MAFIVEGFIDGLPRDDPAYIKYLVRMYGRKDGVSYEKILDYHKCSMEELDHFNQTTRETAKLLAKYKNGRDRYFFCIEWDSIEDDTLSVWGHEEDENYQRWEFLLLPCNYIHSYMGYNKDKQHPDCIANQTAQMKYLENMKV